MKFLVCFERERGGGLKPVSQKDFYLYLDTKDWRGFHAVEYYTTVSVNIFYTAFYYIYLYNNLLNKTAN